MPESKVNMTDIAKRLGISKNTVSLALRGAPGISERTRKLVTDTAGELGYVYRPSEQKNGSARNLCLVVPRSSRESIGFFSFIQLGIEDEAKRNNINTIIHYYEDNGGDFEMPLCIRDGIISGIITLGRVSRKTVDTIDGYGIPLVMVDHYFDDLETDCVLTDNQCGCYMATEYLIKQGHSKLGFVGNIKASISFYDRYMGFLKALETFGLQNEKSYSMLDADFEKLSENMPEAARRIQAQTSLPTAYVCRNDIEAIGLCRTLAFCGISVPEMISVVGFDDIEVSRNVVPGLTTMTVRKELMGRQAVQRLAARMNFTDTVPCKLLISADLIKRDSVRQL